MAARPRNLRHSTSGAGGNEAFLYSPGGQMTLRAKPPVAESCNSTQFREVVPLEHYLHLGGRRVALVQGRLEGPCDGAAGSALTGSPVLQESYAYFSDKMDLARAVSRTPITERGVPAGALIQRAPDRGAAGLCAAGRIRRGVLPQRCNGRREVT